MNFVAVQVRFGSKKGLLASKLLVFPTLKLCLKNDKKFAVFVGRSSGHHILARPFVERPRLHLFCLTVGKTEDFSSKLTVTEAL